MSAEPCAWSSKPPGDLRQVWGEAEHEQVLVHRPEPVPPYQRLERVIGARPHRLGAGLSDRQALRVQARDLVTEVPLALARGEVGVDAPLDTPHLGG